MYKHILLATDGSELAMKAVNAGVALAKAMGARVTAVAVRVPLREFIAEGVTIPIPEATQQDYVKQTDHLLDSARKAAQAAGVACEAVQKVDEEPWRGIIDTAKAQGCDLIVMASHGRRGVSALLLGSETQKVLTHSSIPVLVYR
jgi:nucleotide-binding universal stress UspA family protein